MKNLAHRKTGMSAQMQERLKQTERISENGGLERPRVLEEKQEYESSNELAARSSAITKLYWTPH